MIEAGELELMKFWSSWFEAMEAFNEESKLVEATLYLSHFISYVETVNQNQV